MSDNKLKVLKEVAEFTRSRNTPKSDPLEEKQRLYSIKNVQRMRLCQAHATVKKLEEKLESVAREVAIERAVTRLARNAIVFAVQTVMREGERTELGNSFSEKRSQAIMRTEVNDSAVARESGAERCVSEEEDWASEDSHGSFLISCFAWR